MPRRRPEDLQPICGAKTRDGDPCVNPAVRGATRCRMHGGKSLKGPAHPSYKTGATSEVLPKRMREHYERAVADEDLVSLRNEIAVIDARLLELYSRVDAGESGSRWLELKAQMKLVKAAPDGLELHDQIAVLGKMINAGAVDAYTWREIESLMLTRERLVRSERKRIVEAKMVISMEQAQLVLAAFVDAANEAVGHDQEAMGKIVDAFARITGRSPSLERATG